MKFLKKVHFNYILTGFAVAVWLGCWDLGARNLILGAYVAYIVGYCVARLRYDKELTQCK